MLEDKGPQKRELVAKLASAFEHTGEVERAMAAANE
jgi:hypothetical protein